MTDTIRRPPRGYAISLYVDLMVLTSALPGVIERTQAHIAAQQEYLASCEHQLADATSTLAWMQVHQAQEIAELEAHRANVLAALSKEPSHDQP